MDTAPLIAVTGGTGFIGRHLVSRLLNGHFRVRALCRCPASISRESHPNLEWVRGDMSLAESWNALLKGVDAVAHLGAAGVGHLSDPIAALDQNLPAYRLMLAAASLHRVRRLVVAGSCFEYGSRGDDLVERGLRETDSLAPTNAYAAVKAAGSVLLGPLCRDLGIECFVLRPFHTYGPGEPLTRLVPSVIAAALRGHEISTTDGRQVRDLVHVSDVADAFVKALSVGWLPDFTGSVVLNVSTGVPLRLRDVILDVVRGCGADSSLIRFGAVSHRPHEMWRLVGDPGEAGRVIGWKSKIAWGEGLAAMIASWAPDNRASQ